MPAVPAVQTAPDFEQLPLSEQILLHPQGVVAILGGPALNVNVIGLLHGGPLTVIVPRDWLTR